MSSFVLSLRIFRHSYFCRSFPCLRALSSMAKEYGSKKVAELKVQVDDIKLVMSDNVLKLLERGERLQNLDSRADALHASSQEFQTTARRMQNKLWWDNMKWVLILGFMAVLIFLFIFVSAVY